MIADRARALFLENWGLKLLSFAFAFLLWMFVVGEKRSEVSLPLPLELSRVPQNMVIVSRVPESIRVRLNGPRTLMGSINPQQLAVRLDLDGLQPGISAFEIFSSRLNLPRGIEVTHISPSVITLEADLKIRRTLPVKPRTKGAPAEGFELAEVRASPPQLEVEGAERVVRQLKEIPTETVDVTGLEGSVARPVELALPDPSIRPVEKRPVRLEIVIRETRAEREFIEVPVALPGPGWRALPPTVTIRLEGSLRAVSRLTGSSVSAAVEPFREAPKAPVRVMVNVPAGINTVSVEPNLVEIEPVPAPVPVPSPAPAVVPVPSPVPPVPAGPGGDSAAGSGATPE